jgi:hypothetical protein
MEPPVAYKRIFENQEKPSKTADPGGFSFPAVRGSGGISHFGFRISDFGFHIS